MASKKKLPRSLRKFVRLQKARLRREVLDLEQHQQRIRELYEQLKAFKRNSNAQ